MNKSIRTASPSDFGNYVYCGFKWAYNNNLKLGKPNKPTQNDANNRIEGSRRYVSKKAGQLNEHLCVEWVLQEYDLVPEAIIYNGTGKDNFHFLTSNIGDMKTKMQCQPDLIVRKENKNLLFEFKTTSDEFYPILETFESVYAQVWCYTKLEEIKIDEYHLLKYFINPLESPFNNLTHLSDYELDNTKFERLFADYIKIIDIQNKVSDKNGLTQNDRMNLKKINMPHGDEIGIKCSSCSLKKSKSCSIW